MDCSSLDVSYVMLQSASPHYCISYASPFAGRDREERSPDHHAQSSLSKEISPYVAQISTKKEAEGEGRSISDKAGRLLHCLPVTKEEDTRTFESGICHGPRHTFRLSASNRLPLSRWDKRTSVVVVTSPCSRESSSFLPTSPERHKNPLRTKSAKR